MPSLVLPSAPAKYEPILELGQSATSTAWLAVARGLGGFNKLVVLKALKGDLASDAEAKATFLAEARISARLNHPNIVQVNEVIEREGVPVIVMEYLQGRSLAQILEAAGEQLPLSLRLRAIADALVGLHYAHELTSFDGKPLGMVHRNISPQNVFVTFDGGIKLLDFGIAKLCATNAEMTRAGIIKGQVQYISPEQVLGSQIDRRADLFAMGIVLWELVTGDRFWKGSSEPEILTRLLRDDVPSPRSVRPELPELLERTCLRALARDPGDRYATAEELRRDVEAVISQIGERASSRDLGKLVSEVFAGARAETQRRIDERLRTEAPISATGPIDLPPSSRLSRVVFTTTSNKPVEASLRRGGTPAFRGGLVPLAAVLLVGAGALGWLALSSEDVRPLASASASAQPSASASARRVRVRISAFPPVTQLWLDGKPLASNPAEADAASDDSLHHVRAEAPGYASASREVRFLQDVEVVLNLQLLSAAPSTTPAAPVQPTRRYGGVAPPAVKERPSCEPPYVVDRRGVKRYKPGCL